jgi:hypothetical protein
MHQITFIAKAIQGKNKNKQKSYACLAKQIISFLLVIKLVVVIIIIYNYNNYSKYLKPIKEVS